MLMKEIRADIEKSTPAHMSPFRKFVKSGKLTLLILFLPPALLLFTVFVLLPMAESAFFSPYKWSGYGPAPWVLNEATGQTYGDWVGGQNFRQVAGHSVFATAAWNTVKVIGVSLLIQLPLALALAHMIYEKTYANTVFRLIFFVPFILAEVATGIMWGFALDGNYGLSKTFSDLIGLEKAFFPLADRSWAFVMVMGVVVWKYFGFHMMIFIAALQSIPKEMIESARIDGAKPLQTVFLIKLPLIWPAITISIFYAVLGSLQVFDLVWAMTGDGGPVNSSHTLVSYLYKFGFIWMNVGLGSAVGVILFVVAVLFAFIYRGTVQREAAR